MPSDASIMETRNDFKELLELFSVRSPQDNKHKVEYLVVGEPSCRHRGVRKMRIINVSIHPPSKARLEGRTAFRVV